MTIILLKKLGQDQPTKDVLTLQDMAMQDMTTQTMTTLQDIIFQDKTPEDLETEVEDQLGIHIEQYLKNQTLTIEMLIEKLLPQFLTQQNKQMIVPELKMKLDIKLLQKPSVMELEPEPE